MRNPRATPRAPLWAMTPSLILTLAATLMPACASAPAVDPEPVPQLAEMRGPRRTIAVADFDAVSSFLASHGGWDVGGGLSAMLTTALAQSGQFVVVERGQLEHVMHEQRLAGQNLTSGQARPDIGHLAAAQYLVFGNVTEFGEEDSGGGFSLGLLGGAGEQLAFSPQNAKGRVALDLRVVDSTTGQVVTSFTIKEKIEKRGLSFSLGYKGTSFGGDKFVKTPLGAAARRAIDRAVARLSSEAAGRPWRGRVVDVSESLAYINAGGDDGIRVGDRFDVFRIVDSLTDPETGVVLGEKKARIGSLAVTEVQAKLAVAEWTPSTATPLERGDLVLSL